MFFYDDAVVNITDGEADMDIKYPYLKSFWCHSFQMSSFDRPDDESAELQLLYDPGFNHIGVIDGKQLSKIYVTYEDKNNNTTVGLFSSNCVSMQNSVRGPSLCCHFILNIRTYQTWKMNTTNRSWCEIIPSRDAMKTAAC